MIRLRTIGQVSVHIGAKQLSASNEVIIAALLFLIAERGKPISRKIFAEMFYPNVDPEVAQHSGRQLVYRLRKEKGVAVDGDAASIVFSDVVEWDVEQLLARGSATDVELEAFQRGYLAHFAYGHSDAFSRWLDEHRSAVTRKLRELLVPQIEAARSKRDYRTAGKLAQACLGLDPLNEAATVAAAELLATTGAKNDAVHVLDRYLSDVGPRSGLGQAARKLRERIKDYVVEPDRAQTALVGRAEELETLQTLLDQSAAGHPQICLVSGPAGIGKTRLLEEACSIAALTSHVVATARLTTLDIDRPFSILRDLGPTLLELSGAAGAAPDSRAAVEGLCGRGPNQYSRRPANAYDSRAVAADIERKVVDLVSAVTYEQPLVIRIENADHIDEASLELLEAVIRVERRLCVFMGCRVPVKLSDDLPLGLATTRLPLSPLRPLQASALVQDLFTQAGRDYNAIFAENAMRISAGIPLFLHVLFKHFLATGDPAGLPSTLTDSLTARLDRLEEPAKGVLDVVVTLGRLSTVRRIEEISELPRYSLTKALRDLEEQGFLRSADGALLVSHDLLAEATRRRMPPSVSQLLNRTVATILEGERQPEVDPLEIAIHWQAAGENARASQVLINSAQRSIGLGRPRQAITLLEGTRGWALSEFDRRAVDTSLLQACHAAGEDHLGFAAAERLGGFSAGASAEIQVMAVEMSVGAGKAMMPFRQNLEAIAANRSLDKLIRSRAARLLLILADDSADSEFGSNALQLIGDVETSSSEAILPHLIFEALFGLPEEAVRLANQLLLVARGVEAVGTRLQATWTAAVALRRCGEALQAAEFAVEGFELAKGNSVWSASVAFASMLGDLAWEAGDIQSSQRWFDHGAEIIKRSGGPDRGFQHLGLGISLALHRNDAQAAMKMLNEVERLFPEAMHHRLGVAFLAHRVEIKLALGASLSEQEVQELVSGHLERQALGLHDFVANATIGGLRQLGHFSEAQSLLQQYVSRRKERTAIPQVYARLNEEPIDDSRELSA